MSIFYQTSEFIERHLRNIFFGKRNSQAICFFRKTWIVLSTPRGKNSLRKKTNFKILFCNVFNKTALDELWIAENEFISVENPSGIFFERTRGFAKLEKLSFSDGSCMREIRFRDHRMPRISDVAGKCYSVCSLGVVTAKVVGRPALHLASPPSVEGREPALPRQHIWPREFEI